MDSEEAARWLNSAMNHLSFLASLAPKARIKTRAFSLVIQFIPLHFGPERDKEVCSIETTNKMSPGSIIVA